MSLADVEASITAALAAGVCSNAIASVLARAASWGCGPAVLSIKLSVVGRRQQIRGARVTKVEAVELRFVDGRWRSANYFCSLCLKNETWAQRLEQFSRRLGHPVLLSRHGASRDYALLSEVMLATGIPCFPVRGCSAMALCANGAFPADIAEVASFLNVLGITPSAIDAAAQPVVAKQD